MRIYPTYKIAADLNLLNSYAGLTLPLIASATATLFSRQFFMTIPDEPIEASKLDGAGPFRFFGDTLLPLSRTNIAALFVILFIYGWTQYLWPILITTRDDMQTIVIGIKKMIVTADALTEWNVAMATAMRRPRPCICSTPPRAAACGAPDWHTISHHSAGPLPVLRELQPAAIKRAIARHRSSAKRSRSASSRIPWRPSALPGESLRQPIACHTPARTKP